MRTVKPAAACAQAMGVEGRDPTDAHSSQWNSVKRRSRVARLRPYEERPHRPCRLIEMTGKGAYHLKHML